MGCYKGNCVADGLAKKEVHLQISIFDFLMSSIMHKKNNRIPKNLKYI